MGRIKLCTVLLVVGISVLGAQDRDIRKHPGFIDLSNIKIPGYSSETTDISLGPALLALAGNMDNGDKELADALKNLFSIQVKSFNFREGDAGWIRSIVKKLDKKVKNENWQSLVNVKSGDEIANISLKFEDGKMAGLFIMSLDDEEVTFVNMVGTINLSDIGKITSEFSESSSALDSLQELSKKEEK